MKQQKMGFRIAVAMGLLTLSVNAGPGFGKSVMRMNELEQAQQEARSKGKAMTFLYTEENSTCPLCEKANWEVVNGMKARTVVVYMANGKEFTLAPAIVQQGLLSDRAGKYIPQTVVVDPEYKEIIAIIPYDTSAAEMKASVSRAKKSISKFFADRETGNPPASLSGDSPPAVRTWTSQSGATIEAMFVKCVLDVVYLETEDGRTIQIPINKLSPEDQTNARRAGARN